MASPQANNAPGIAHANGDGQGDATAMMGGGGGGKGYGASPSSYKRASRKGAPRRFVCEHAGCEKIYSRAEHLQRHQLNHNPREIFRCDVGDCDQKFVRLDLLSRHKKRHSATYTPRNRIPSFEVGGGEATTAVLLKSPPTSRGGGGRGGGHSSFVHTQAHYGSGSVPAPSSSSSSGPHDAAILLTPESNVATTPTGMNHPQRQPWGAPSSGSMEERVAAAGGMMQHRSNFYAADPSASMPDAAAMVGFGNVPYGSDDVLVQGNFASWLFDPQTTYSDFSMATLPFLEEGLESTFNNNIHYDYESLTSLSPMDHLRHVEASDDVILEPRRQEICQWFQVFRKKHPKYDTYMQGLLIENGGDLPNLHLEMMRECLKEFWDTVSLRLPIIHQHTFSPNRCPIFLLFVMLALGASSLRNRDISRRHAEYGAFGDLIICCVRWEILTSDDAAPPASLWVTQALLLLEFYEKLFSSRKLHERAHIYHPAFLTLLRRGSPLIGRTGSESPPEPDGLSAERHTPNMGLDSRTWWVRWAETESMHRVVFGAFMLDTIDAAMFGHSADMAAHEIRLPLPCDDSLWTASSPDVVRQLDANLRMYGVKQVSFLDGLKNALHGKEVKTHAFGRMIIISGLFSVGWHLSHRDTHLKWLDLRTPPAGAQDNWRKLLLSALDSWKGSFDVAMTDPLLEGPGQRGVSNGPISSAAVLYHLAHISLHIDIIDLQVFAGAKRLLGRKVSSRDHANAVKRMTAWAKQASTRHAILHAFKLLHRILVDSRHPPGQRRGYHHGSSPQGEPSPPSTTTMTAAMTWYSVKQEADPHKSWLVYYSALCIWAFVQAVCRQPQSTTTMTSVQKQQQQKQAAFARGREPPAAVQSSSYVRAVEYLTRVASLPDLDDTAPETLRRGVGELLEVVVEILGEADTELLMEARDRLVGCKEMLLAGSR